MLPFLQQCKSLHLLMTLDGGLVNVQVHPVPLPGATDGLRTPMVLKGSAQELDAGFEATILSYVGGNQAILEQIETTKALLEAERLQLANKKASGKAAAKNKPSASTTEADDSEEEQNEEGDSNSAAPAETQQAEDSDSATTASSANPLDEINLF
ncbi:PRTRC system protein E [Undibacterium sp. Di27W]|uniref:PRTRC system protein E n=1 Tax=Undibacterium sp. Di27W TaxID=3413036 RepID=UPI003BF3EEBA